MEPSNIQPSMITPATEKPIETPKIEQKPPKKRSLKIMILSLLSIGVLLVSSVSAYAYTAWYSAPEKVLADTIIGMMLDESSGAAGSLKMAIEGGELELAFDMTAPKTSVSSADIQMKVLYQGESYAMSAGYIMDGTGDIYLKMSDFQSIIDTLKREMATVMTEEIDLAIDNMVEKIDGEWIRISAEDMDMYSSEASSAQTCVEKVTKHLEDDKNAIKQLTDLYDKNRFIVIDKELGEKNGNLGYEVLLSNDEAKQFVVGLKDTSVYKVMQDCEPDFELDPEMFSGISDESDDNYKLEIWSSTWGHKLQEIKLLGNDPDQNMSMTLSIKPQYGTSRSVVAPEESMTLEELSDNMMEFVYAIYGIEGSLDQTFGTSV
jgi:hypothetical protein